MPAPGLVMTAAHVKGKVCRPRDISWLEMGESTCRFLFIIVLCHLEGAHEVGLGHFLIAHILRRCTVKVRLCRQAGKLWPSALAKLMLSAQGSIEQSVGHRRLSEFSEVKDAKRCLMIPTRNLSIHTALYE